MPKLNRKEKGGIALFAACSVAAFLMQANPNLQPELDISSGRATNVGLQAFIVALMQVFTPIGVAALCWLPVPGILIKARKRQASTEAANKTKEL